MFKNKGLLFAFVTIVLSGHFALAQNNTNSPYTRFGYGDISDNNTGEQRAMGGTALGLRSKTSINTVNPASYSSVDSMTFMFDVGLSGLYSRFSTTEGRAAKPNANLEYITMRFPLWKNMGFSAGLLPYSFSGYNFYSVSSLTYNNGANIDSVTYSFAGNGAISQVYGGLSWDILKHISVGFNAYYMFGSIVNSRTVTFGSAASNFYPSYQSDSISVGSFRFRYGLQFHNTFNKKHDVTLGLIYEMKNKLRATYSESTGSVEEEATPYREVFSKFEVPEIYGAGLAYTYNKQLTIGLDYTLQHWASAQFFGVTDTLSNRSKVAFGAEYLPNPRGRYYFSHVLYRAGVNMSDPYYKIDGGVQPKNFGVSVGLGLPIKSLNTVVNASFEYGKIGSVSKLREDYFRLSLNAVFNENWFFKRKL